MHTTLSSVPVADRSPRWLENSPRARRRVFWLGLIVVWLFTAGFLQLGLVDRLAVPASERVNNGDHATYFAVDINPYYLFSEDFHLYAVRSKRILERGWTDSPLAHSPHERTSYAAPLQAALMMLAVATDGRPVPYSIFVVGVLAVAWSILYVAAALWLSPRVSPLTIPIAVMVTVLFESIGGVFHPTSDYDQWPVDRGLRMATLAWSNPLVLALVIAVVSLLFRRDRSTGRLIFIGVVLATLAAADTWAYLLSAGCVGVVIAVMAALAIFRRDKLVGGVRPLVTCGVVLTGIAVVSLAINRTTSGGFQGDLLARAGFGPAWRHSLGGMGGLLGILRDIRYEILLLAAISILATTYFRWRPFGAGHSPQLLLHWDWPTIERRQLFCLAAVPIVAWIGVIAALGVFGMDEYHAFQFAWRRDYMLLFVLAVLVSELAKHLLRRILPDSRRSLRWEIAGTAAFFVSLFAYHSIRIHNFVAHTAAREYFLTKDEEELHEWLRQREPSLGKFTLATASHELNYLCAYWTNAELLLPEGFPFHSGDTDAEIKQRMATLLAIYGVSPESWLAFNLNRHVWDQWSWAHSRLLSARHGYLYYLMHRALLVDGIVGREVLPTAAKWTTPFFADLGLQRDQYLRTGKYFIHRAGVREEDEIAELLQETPTVTSADRPDVIVVDEVSRGLGTPDLGDYTREFQHGDLEAWVRIQRR
jgi:hypothetical protein